jgi:hypothetical protein
MSDQRWIVERPSKGIEDVGADFLKIEDACLIFTDATGDVLIAYSPGTWVTVVPEPQ